MNVSFDWDDENEPNSNVEVLRQFGLTEEDLRHAFAYGVVDPDVSNMSGWPVLFGPAEDGRPLAVIYRWEDPRRIYVIGIRIGE